MLDFLLIIINATSGVAVFPGYLSGALGFKKELQIFDRTQLIRLSVITILGGLVGSLLLLVSSNEAFSIVVPFLLFGATLTFLFGEKIRNWAESKSRSVTPFGAFGLFLVSIYGGYSIGGLVEWRYAIVMMIAAMIGGYAGAPIARALPKQAVRALIAIVGFTMSAVFFWRLII